MLAQAWIKVRQDFDQVLKQKSRLSSLLEHKFEQNKIYYEYSTQNLDQTANLGINLSRTRFNLSSQIKIEMRQLA